VTADNVPNWCARRARGKKKGLIAQGGRVQGFTRAGATQKHLGKASWCLRRWKILLTKKVLVWVVVSFGGGKGSVAPVCRDGSMRETEKETSLQVPNQNDAEVPCKGKKNHQVAG